MCETQQIEIERLKNRIMKLENLIRAILAHVARIETESGKVLAHRSGVPRGNWAYARGVYKVATDVKRLLQRGIMC